MTKPPAAFLAAAKDLLGPKGWSEDPEQLDKVATRKCRECAGREEMRQCSKCGDKKVERDFTPGEWRLNKCATRTCQECAASEEQRQCSQCGDKKN